MEGWAVELYLKTIQRALVFTYLLKSEFKILQWQEKDTHTYLFFLCRDRQIKKQILNKF